MCIRDTRRRRKKKKKREDEREKRERGREVERREREMPQIVRCVLLWVCHQREEEKRENSERRNEWCV